MEYMEVIYSLETELQIESICSIRIFSTEEVIEVFSENHKMLNPSCGV